MGKPRAGNEARLVKRMGTRLSCMSVEFGVTRGTRSCATFGASSFLANKQRKQYFLSLFYFLSFSLFLDLRS